MITFSEVFLSLCLLVFCFLLSFFKSDVPDLVAQKCKVKGKEAPTGSIKVTFGLLLGSTYPAPKRNSRTHACSSLLRVVALKRIFPAIPTGNLMQERQQGYPR